MTNNELELPSASVDRLGQATAVEQSRAIAQVQAAAVMARQFPRSTQAAINEMRDACGRSELAKRAFFKFPRGGESVTGASVYLARELARIWGNIDYGLNELRRDDMHGQSEMQAYAWDLQTNARSTRTFVIEHARDTKQGRKQLTDLRDISDNNNNFGARAVREMIFATLPQWFTDMAQEVCRETLKNGGGVPLPTRVANALAGSVLASDAFFPFDDCVKACAEAGISCIIQLGGSVRDQDSIDACDRYGIAMVFTGMRHFKH